MKVDIRDLRGLKAKRNCEYCQRIGTIEGLEPYTTNLFVHRRCDSDCVNNFENNGKQWVEIMPYEEYSSEELRELIDWVEKTKEVVYRFEGKRFVVGWDGDRPHKLGVADQKRGLGEGFLTEREYVLIRMKAVLREADNRAAKIRDLKRTFT